MSEPRREPGIEWRSSSDGRYQYRGTTPDPANRKRKKRGPWTYSFAEAKGWRVKMMGRKAEGLLDPEDARMPTLREAADDFIAGIQLGTVLSPRTKRAYAASTTRDYEQAFRDWIVPRLGDRPVDRLHADEVQRLVDEIAAVRAPQTVRNIFHALAALYTYLRKRNRRAMLHDPTAEIDLPVVGDNVRKRIVEASQMAELLAALDDDHLAAPYALAYLAGLRYAEIQSLPVDHIDLQDGWIDVAYSLDPREGFKGPKSYAGIRPVPIFDGLRPYLERQVAWVERRVGRIVPSTDDEPGTLLLPSLRGSRFGTRELGGSFTRACYGAWGWEADGPGRWKPVEGEEQLPNLTLHEARHSFATALVRAGYDVKDVQEWVGHSDVATTLNRYVKARGRVGNSAKVTDRMNRFLEG